MQDKETIRLFKLIAASRSAADVLALFEKLSNIVCDVRQELPGGGSIESRKAADAVLRHAIDSLKRVRDNHNRGQAEDDADDPL